VRLARIEYRGLIEHAVLETDSARLISGDIFYEWELTDQVVPLAGLKLLPPVTPPQIIGIGLNYRKHAAESGLGVPDAPVVFIKTLNTITGPNQPIVLPAMAPSAVDFEAELVIVIGHTCRNVSPDDALDYVLGYTCGNDVSARDCQLQIDKQWARGKCFDTFAPVGPWIETDIDPGTARIRSWLNGEIMQDSTTEDLIFPCDELISYLSQCMTLYPGSIILTGTPEGVGMAREPQLYLQPGDTISVEIDGIGTLTNHVENEAY